MALNVTDATFDKEVMQATQPVLVDFWAEWCGPCKMLSPVIDEIAKEYAGKLKVCKVDLDQANQVASRYGIMSIPTVAIFKKGQPVDMVVGAVPKQALVKAIEKHI